MLRCVWCSAHPYEPAETELELMEVWARWHKQETEKKNDRYLNVVSVTPSDTFKMKKRIFEEKFLPEFCGMNADEYANMPEGVLKRSVSSTFFDSCYAQLFRDHTVDVIMEFAKHLSVIPDSVIMESSDGNIFYRTDEHSLPLAFSNAIITRMSRATGPVKAIVTSSDPTDIRITSGGRLLCVLRLKSQVWDFLHTARFNPDEVAPLPYVFATGNSWAAKPPRSHQ